MARCLVRPLPVRVSKAGYIALDLEVVADREGEVRELLARRGRRGLRRRGELEAVAEGPGVGGRAGLAAQPPPAAPRDLREDDDPGDGDARDDPGAGVGGPRGARSRRGVHGRGGGGGG